MLGYISMFIGTMTTDGNNWPVCWQPANVVDLLTIYVAIQSHYYRLESIDKDGKKQYSTIQQITIKPQTTIGLSIYPNPASNAAYIATKNVKEIRLIDALGRVYFTKKIDNTNNTGFTYLPLNYIANGTYWVQAIDNSGQVKTGKLVVVK